MEGNPVAVSSAQLYALPSRLQLPKAGIVELDFIEPKHPAADVPVLDATDMILLMRPNGRRWVDWKLQVSGT